jgi:hypothetical protein
MLVMVAVMQRAGRLHATTADHMCSYNKRVLQYLAVRPELKLQELVPELPFVSHIVAHIEVFCRHRSGVRTSWM